MKKSLLALAAMLTVGVAFATSPDITTTGITPTGNAKVSGAINNSITATATVNNGPGTSFSGAWSVASAAASASTTGIAKVITTGPVCAPTVIGADVTGHIAGTTDTSAYGVAYNTSSGSGNGSATVNGWSDAGSTADFSATVPGGVGAVATKGSIDTGHPNTGFGSDINVSAVKDQAVYAEGQAGGTFDSKVTLVTTNTGGTVTGKVFDTKSTTDYANTFSSFGTDVNKNFVSGTGKGSVNVIDASSTSLVNASGNFLVNTTLANVTK